MDELQNLINRIMREEVEQVEKWLRLSGVDRSSAAQYRIGIERSYSHDSATYRLYDIDDNLIGQFEFSYIIK